MCTYMKSDRIVFRIDEAIKEQFRKKCESKDKSMSEVLEGFVRYFVKV